MTAGQALTGDGQSAEPQPWSISSEDGGTMARIVIELDKAASVEERDALLCPGIVATVERLAAIGSMGAVVDVRTADSVGSERAWEGFVEALRGLVQSLALERGPEAGPVNLMISSVEQDDDRNATMSYLTSDTGGF